MSFPAYSEYKNSNVDWLCDIPASWAIRPLWTIFRRHKLVGFSDEQLLSVYRDYGVIPKSSRDDNFNKPSDDLGAYQLVEVGDLAINKMKAWQGSVGISKFRGIVSPAYHVYSPTHSEDSQYLHYLMRCNEYIAGYLANSKGIRVSQWDLEPQQHSRMLILFPPLKEQTQIARFLDHETARIDALIEQQQRLIELLKEKRQAVISHAVTKGLDPTVPMKDSGVEWLGEVPAHWRVSPLKYLCSFTGGGTPSKENLEYWNGDIPWVSPKDMKSFLIDGSIDKITEVAIQESSTTLIGPGALLMVVRSGILQRTIPVAINSVDVTLNQDMKALQFLNRKFARYFAYFVVGLEQSLLLAWRKQGATVESIEQEYLNESQIPIPPEDELASIIAHLNALESEYVALEASAIRSTELLTERRTALISAAVTGKIDVRNWQPPTSHREQQLQQELAHG